MSTSRTAQRPSSVAYLPRSHRSPLSARTRAEAILPALALTLTYFKKLTLRASATFKRGAPQGRRVATTTLLSASPRPRELRRHFYELSGSFPSGRVLAAWA